VNPVFDSQVDNQRYRQVNKCEPGERVLSCPAPQVSERKIDCVRDKGDGYDCHKLVSVRRVGRHVLDDYTTM